MRLAMARASSHICAVSSSVATSHKIHGGVVEDRCESGCWRGLVHQWALNPRSQKRDLHPIDEDLSMGTPDLGHPDLW
jgi:hypothetical protein